jgi:hypothetical protein
MSTFPVLKPDLQVSLYSRLQALRERYLIESLKKTVEAEDFNLKTVNSELTKYADGKNLKRIASFGLRGEVFFPVPYVLSQNPFLLGYYRLLLGFSRKAFYEQGPFKRFDSLEDRGKVKDALEPQLSALCVSLSKSASMLVEWINPISLGIVNELQNVDSRGAVPRERQCSRRPRSDRPILQFVERDAGALQADYQRPNHLA